MYKFPQKKKKNMHKIYARFLKKKKGKKPMRHFTHTVYLPKILSLRVSITIICFLLYVCRCKNMISKERNISDNINQLSFINTCSSSDLRRLFVVMAFFRFSIVNDIKTQKNGVRFVIRFDQ